MRRIISMLMAVTLSLAGFGCAQPVAQEKPDTQSGARKELTPAIKELQGLGADVEVGLTYEQYSDALLKANRAVKATDPKTPEGLVAKVDLEEAVNYHDAARTAWSYDIQGGWPHDYDVAAEWVDKYPEVVKKLPGLIKQYPELGGLIGVYDLEDEPDYVSAEDVRQAAWEIADSAVENAVRTVER